MAKRKGILGRSDIPYAQRMKMKKQAMIVHERETAAKAIMFCNAVALHELEGIGYKRLVRYALHFKQLTAEESWGMPRHLPRIHPAEGRARGRA